MPADFFLFVVLFLILAPPFGFQPSSEDTKAEEESNERDASKGAKRQHLTFRSNLGGSCEK